MARISKKIIAKTESFEHSRPMTPDQIECGHRLRDARIQRKMSQGELAELIGVKRQTIVLWELGKTEPGALKLWRVANELATTIEWLLTGEGDGPDSGGRAALRAMIRNLERKLETIDATR